MVTETQLLRMHSASRPAIGVIDTRMTGLMLIGVAFAAMLLVGAASVAIPVLNAVAELDH